MHRGAAEGHRVLISAPYGRDAQSVAALLQSHGYGALPCDGLDVLAQRFDEHAGAILVTEEALATDLGPLHRALEGQPAWSDIPFILLAGRQAGRALATEAIRRRLPDNATNVVLLERPLSTESLLSAIASAMRARQKQFQLRDQVAALEDERRRLFTLLENLPVGVAFVGASGETQVANPAFRRFTPQGSIPSRDRTAQSRWEAYEADGTRVAPEDFPGARSLRGELAAGTEFLYHASDDDSV